MADAILKTRSAEPSGRTAKFIEAFTRRYGLPFARSWLSSRTCQFEEGTIWTGAFAASWLRENCIDLLSSHRVMVRHDAESRAHAQRGADQYAQTKAKAGAG